MKLESPAAVRNRQPILDMLAHLLPESARILELASGPGAHAQFFAARRSGWTIQPTDFSEPALASITAYTAQAGPNLLQPAGLNVCDIPWPIEGPFDAVLAINLLHVAPWAAAKAVMENAHSVMDVGAALLLYGPFLINGEAAPSNHAFDQDLRRRDPEWGLRDVADLIASSLRLRFITAHEMPANNHLLEFRRI